MDESPRRTSGTKTSGSGRRLKLIAVYATALLVAGFAATQFPVFGTAERVARLAGPDCFLSDGNGPTPGDECNLLPAADNIVRAIVGIVDPAPDDSAAEAPAGVHAGRDITGSERVRHAVRVTAPDLRPGYTLAETCGASAETPGIHCRTIQTRANLRSTERSGSDEQMPTFTISGRVLSAADGGGLANVPILATAERTQSNNASPAPTAQRFRTITDEFGAYALTGLPDGDYTLSTGNLESHRAARITARTGVDYANIIVSPHTRTLVQGQVLDADGGPLEGVTVLPVALGQPSTITADDGRFELSLNLNEEVNSVTLRFQRPGYSENLHKVELNSVHTDSSSDALEAGVRIVMQPVDTWTSLAGFVYSDAGDPLPARIVELRPVSGPAQRTTTDAKGHYEFPVLESPADYRLLVRGGEGYRDSQQKLRLTPATSELDVVIDAYQFGAVTGQLRNVNGEPVPDFQLVLRNTGSQQPNAVVTSDSGGNFEIPLAPAGDLVMASQSTPSILVQGLRLAAGERLNMPLIIDWGQHELRGIVVDANDNPLPASRIVLEWSHQADRFTTHATRRTATDTQGQFAFSQLGPGPHSLRIDAPGYRTFALEHDPSQQGYAVTVRLN